MIGIYCIKHYEKITFWVLGEYEEVECARRTFLLFCSWFSCGETKKSRTKIVKRLKAIFTYTWKGEKLLLILKN